MKSLVVFFLAVQSFLRTSAFLPISKRLSNRSLITASAFSGIPTTSVTEGSDFLTSTAVSLLTNNHEELFQLVSSHPLTLSLYAGLSTCLGAAVVFLAGHDDSIPNKNKAALTDDHLALSLSLAGSVMVTVTVISLLPESFHDTSTLLLPNVAVERCLSMAAGCGLYLLLARCTFPDDSVIFRDNDEKMTGTSVLNSSKSQHGLALVPPMHPGDVLPTLQEYHVNDNQIVVEERGYALKGLSTGEDLVTEEARRSWRIAILLFLSLAVHNFPEGLAVAASAVHSPQLGLTTAIAIALHNIAEGVAIAVPCLAARPESPWLAFGLASLSGLAEPLGAFVAVTFLQGDVALRGMPDVLASVGGIMVTVALLELFPEALRHSRGNYGPFLGGLLSGAFVMIGSEKALMGL